MKKQEFGKTGLMVSRIAFGGIPIQRISKPEAVSIVRKIIDMGVNFIDTANAYSDSEEKIGEAIKTVRRETIVLASKSTATDKKTFLEHLDLCLKRLGTDYIDFYQLHNLSTEKAKNTIFGENGAFEAMENAVKAGKVRFPAFSSHNIPIAIEIMKTRKFSAVQLPFNFVDDSAKTEAIPLAEKLGMGFIAMKPFGGGLLDNAYLAIRYLLQFRSIIPDPGIEKISEIEEIIKIVEENKAFTEDDEKEVAAIKEQKSGFWCHRCDYCQPCPQGIAISSVLTVESVFKRMPLSKVKFFCEAAMAKARSCLKCDECISRCPYNLPIPQLIEEKLSFWDANCV